ncbi:cell adhesion molecule 1-like isoform X2 [Stegodyphus dumicola]|uniref:cell adhesion molecule 1-like isoform X2 n=1 Tax=Stegodyphus dumicola TaxID=202533 RepID=UPI0015AB4E95|nr:cell adhesion molecule 1-like isoform X2 [Stegodyphus dumicola]
MSERPWFEKDYETVAGEEGASLEILCSANGRPPIAHTWYDKNDLEVSSMGFNRIFTALHPKGTLLVFKETRRNDSGEYRCSASNIHGMVSKVFQLYIVPKSGRKLKNLQAKRKLPRSAQNTSIFFHYITV